MSTKLTKAELELLVSDLQARVQYLEGCSEKQLRSKAHESLRNACDFWRGSPLWNEIVVKRLSSGQVNIWFEKAYYNSHKQECTAFNGMMSLALEGRGHTCKWARDHLQVTLRALPSDPPVVATLPPEPKDSEPEFNDCDDGPSDAALARQVEDAALLAADRSAAEVI